MRFAFYCGVLLVAAAGVVFGLDWMSAPMPPMPDVKNVVFVPPPPPAPPRVAQPAPAASPPANAATSASTPAAPPAPVAAAQNRAPEVAPAPPPVAAPAPPPVATAAPPPKCDIDACARAYRSFQESDCTYNPSFGPRRLCTKGDPAKYAREHAEPVAATPAPEPAASAAAPTAEPPGAIMAPEPGTTSTAAAPARCNVAACAAAYPRSFRESDCTYNPSSGARKLCEK